MRRLDHSAEPRLSLSPHCSPHHLPTPPSSPAAAAAAPAEPIDLTEDAAADAAKKVATVTFAAATKPADVSAASSSSTTTGSSSTAASPTEFATPVRAEESAGSAAMEVETPGGQQRESSAPLSANAVETASTPTEVEAAPVPAAVSDPPATPYAAGAITVVSWGVVEPLGKYHTKASVFPVGYVSEREYDSFVTAGTKTVYRSEVLADASCDDPVDAVARFRVTAADAPEDVFTGKSASGPWTAIAQRAYALKHAGDSASSSSSPSKKRKHKVDLGGPMQYGFTQSAIKTIIDAMPRVDECARYVRLALRPKKGRKKAAKKAKKVKTAKAPKKKRAKSAYNFFVAQKRAEIAASEAGLTPQEIMKRLGAAWSAIDATEKVAFTEMATADKARVAVEAAAEPVPAAAAAAAAPAAVVGAAPAPAAAGGGIGKWVTAQPSALAVTATAVVAAPAVPEVPHPRVAVVETRMSELVQLVFAVKPKSFSEGAAVNVNLALALRHGVEHRLATGATALQTALAALAEGEHAPVATLVATISARIASVRAAMPASASDAAPGVIVVEGAEATATAAEGQPAAAPASAPASAPVSVPVLASIDAAAVRSALLLVAERKAFGVPCVGNDALAKLNDSDSEERVWVWETRNAGLLGFPSQYAPPRKARRALQVHIRACSAVLKLLRKSAARRAASSAKIAKTEASLRRCEASFELRVQKAEAARMKSVAAATAKATKAAAAAQLKATKARLLAEKKAERERVLLEKKKASEAKAKALKAEREAKAKAKAALQLENRQAREAKVISDRLEREEAKKKQKRDAKTAGSASLFQFFGKPKASPKKAKAAASGSASASNAAGDASADASVSEAAVVDDAATKAAAAAAATAAADIARIDRALDAAWGGSDAERALKRKRVDEAARASSSAASSAASSGGVAEVDAKGAPKFVSVNWRDGQAGVKEVHTRGWGNRAAKAGPLSGRRKLIGHHDDENGRPAFYGTMLRRWQVRACTPETMTALNTRLKLVQLKGDVQSISSVVSFRRPFARDNTLIAYDEDSDELWGMEDDDGEDLDEFNDDDEAQAAEEADYVMDGWLCSDEEVDYEGEEGGAESGGGAEAAAGGGNGKKWQQKKKRKVAEEKPMECGIICGPLLLRTRARSAALVAKASPDNAELQNVAAEAALLATSSVDAELRKYELVPLMQLPTAPQFPAEVKAIAKKKKKNSAFISVPVPLEQLSALARIVDGGLGMSKSIAAFLEQLATAHAAVATTTTTEEGETENAAASTDAANAATVANAATEASATSSSTQPPFQPPSKSQIEKEIRAMSTRVKIAGDTRARLWVNAALRETYGLGQPTPPVVEKKSPKAKAAAKPKKERKKRSKSAYMLFCDVHRSETKAGLEAGSNGGKFVMVALAAKWKEASDEAKAPFIQLASTEKARVAAEVAATQAATAAAAKPTDTRSYLAGAIASASAEHPAAPATVSAPAPTPITKWATAQPTSLAESASAPAAAAPPTKVAPSPEKQQQTAFKSFFSAK